MTNELTFNKIFNFFIFYLKLVGIKINMEPINERSLSMIILNYFNLAAVSALVVHFIYSVILYCIDKDLQNLFFITPCITYSTLAILKFYAISLNKNLIEILFVQYAKYNNEENSAEVEKVCQKFERRQMFILKKIMLAVIIINGMTLIVFCLTPLLLMAVEYITKKNFVVFLIFPLTYPVNPANNIFTYLVIYSYQAYAGNYY